MSMHKTSSRSRTRERWNANLAKLPEIDAVALRAIERAGEGESTVLPNVTWTKPKRGQTTGDNSVLLDKKIQNKLLQSLARGTSIDSAMAEVGISPRSFYYFKEKARASNNPEMHKLLQKVEVAFELGVRNLETQALKQSMFDPAMTKFLLIAKKPELYGQAHIGKQLPHDFLPEDPKGSNIHNTLLVFLQNAVTADMDADQIAEAVRTKFKQVETFRREKVYTIEEINKMNSEREWIKK